MPRYRRDGRAMPLYISIPQRAVSLPQHAFLVGLYLQTVNQIARVRVKVSRDLKLFGGEIIFEVFHLM